MSIEDPRLSSIDNTSAADEFDSAVEQHLGFGSETADGIEVAQAETPDAGRTDRLPAQAPVEAAAAIIPSEVSPDAGNVVTLPAGIELDNLEFRVDGANLVLVLADGTEIVVLGGAANIPTFVIGDVELPQVVLFAALEGSNINVAAGPDGTFSAQGGPTASRNFNDDPIDAGPEDLALADLLGDTNFGDELRTGTIFGGAGAPSIPLEIALTESFIYDEAVIADSDTGNQIISGRLPFNPGPDFGTITRINFTGASNVDEEGDGPQVLAGFTSGGRLITVVSFPAPTDGADLDFVAIEGRDSEGTLVFTLTVTNRVTGDFTFELVGQLDHPDAGQNGSQDDLDDLLRLGFTYTVTDRDGDSVTGSFNIDVMDDAPEIGEPEIGRVDEDGFWKGNPDEVPESEGEVIAFQKEPSLTSTGGNLNINWGADNGNAEVNGGNTSIANDRAVYFTRASIDALITQKLTSEGLALRYEIWEDGTRLVAFQEGPGAAEGVIFSVTLSDTGRGSYEFVLSGTLDHPDENSGVGQVEEDIPLVFGFAVRDSDGDTATSSFTVNVNDDSPITVGSVAMTVAENDIANRLSIGSDPFNQDEGEDSRSLLSLLGVGFASTVSGELATSVSFGADGAAAGGGFSFTSDAVSTLNGMGLLSKGSPVVFTIINGAIVGYVNNAFGGFQPLIDRPVMSLELDKQTGEFVFRLYDQLDHVEDSAVAENTVLATKVGGVAGTLNNLDFGKIIKATDGDGDSISLDGKLVITIKDDVPEVSITNTGAMVVHDETADSQGTETTSVSGIFSSLGTAMGYARADVIDYSSTPGADEPLTRVVSLELNVGEGNPADGLASGLFTTSGSPITLFVEGNLIVGRDGSGNVALAVSIDPQGRVSIAQYQPLKHGDPDATNEPLDLTGKINAVVTVTDNDGDVATDRIDIGANIQFLDDAPVAGGTVALTVAENDIANRLSIGSDPFHQGTGEDSQSLPALLGVGFASTVSDSLASKVSFGADGQAAGGGFSFTSDAVSTLNGMGLLSKGSSVVFTIFNGAIVGYVNNAFGGFQPLIDRPVMSLELDKQTGEFVFRLYDQLDHVGDSAVAENTVLATKVGGVAGPLDNLDFGKIIKATDGDGDSISLDGKLVITIKDDVPELTGKTEARTVDEDDIRTSQSLGTSPADYDADGSWTGGPGQGGNGGAFIDGSLAYLVKGGADDAVKFSFSDDAASVLQGLGLKSKGDLLSYEVKGNILYAYDNNDGTAGYGAGDRVVFKLTLNSNGSYSFELIDQLDHVKPDAGADENFPLQPSGLLAINFGSVIEAKDFDGDSIKLGNAFSIEVRDDVPVHTGEVEKISLDAPELVETTVGKVANFVLVLDTSGSVTLSQIQSQVTQFLNSLANSGAEDVRVHIVRFAGDAAPVGTFDLIQDGAIVASQLTSALTAIGQLPSGGATNYEAGLQQALQWIEGAPSQTISVNTTISSFDANTNGPFQGNGNNDTAHIIGNGTTQIALVSGWRDPGTNTGHLEDAVGNTTDGWGVVDGDVDRGEILRFDFGAFNDFDGANGAYANVGNFSGVPVVSATFKLDRESDNSPIFRYTVHFVDGTSETFTRTVSNNDTSITVGGSGKEIAYVEFMIVDNGRSSGYGDVDLQSVVTAPIAPGTLEDADVNQLIFLSDGQPNATQSGSANATNALQAIIDEITRIESDTDGPGRDQKFTIEAFGVGANASGLGNLGKVEGPEGSSDNVSSGSTLTSAMQPVLDSLVETTVTGQSVSGTFDVKDLVAVGADDDITFSLGTNTSGLPQQLGGMGLIYSFEAGLLVAKSGGATVFTLALSPDGKGTFTLYKPLGQSDVNIDFSSIVRATDFDGDSIALATGKFVVTVVAPNVAPTDIALSAATVAENAAGAVIGTLTTTDPNAGNTHTYTVSDNRFEVVGNQLKLQTGVSLNYEAEPTVNVTVMTKDGGNLSYSETFAITVTNVNEKPTEITLSASTVAENAAGAVIGTLATTDPDAGDMHSYTVDDDRFEVVGGQLKLKDGVSLDHEVAASVNVTVTTTDVGGLSHDQTFAITVTNVNEKPTEITLSASTVAENAAGAVIGALATMDPDAGDTHSYTVDDDRFEVLGGQLKLKDGVSLDHEVAASVNVTVTTTDAGGLSHDQTFAITVTNVNEKPTEITLSASTVAENAAGAVIGTLATTDPDAGDTHSYTVDDDRFEVLSGQLKLKDGVSLDHEAAASVNVKVTTTDAGGLSHDQTFAITVTNVNEKPTEITLSASTVAENAAGAVIGALATTDPDAGDTHSYTVDDDRFEVVGGQLKLKDGVSLDYEAAASVNVKVTTTDAGGLSHEQTFAITVTDVNEVVAQDPTGQDKTVNLVEDVTYTFKTSDFGYQDADGHTFAGVTVTPPTGTSAGKLMLGNVLISGTQFVTAEQIAAGMLTWAPADNVVGSNGSTLFTFKVKDSSGAEDSDANAVRLQMSTTNFSDFNETANVTLGVGAGFANASVSQTTSGTERITFGDTNAAGNAFSGLNFQRSDNNLEITVTTEGVTRVITVLDQYAGGNSVWEQVRFDEGVFAGYDFSGRTYALSTGLNGGNGNSDDIVAGSAAADLINGGNGRDLLFGNGGNDTINGESGNDLIFGGLGNDTIDGGQDDDVIVGGAGNDVLTGGSGRDRFVWGDELLSGDNADRITDYRAQDDIIDLSRLLPANTSSVNYIKLVRDGNDLLVKVDLDGNGNASAPELAYRLVGGNDLASVVINYGGSNKNFTRPSGGWVAAADPIILDLDKNGFAFSPIGDGVTFDINADGKADQIAWTSDDGILAYDVDGNGLIDNGSEIFTPDFNGGKFASGVAALASLDTNGDGKIDANDDAFSKLQIWVDADNDGVSDEGELSNLFDNGVTSISLTTDNTGGQEDGQTVFSTGTFTFADGSTGDFMEVGFDTIFGSDADPLTVMGTDGDDILHGGMGQVVMTGGAGADTFVFDATALDELDVADVITDFNSDEGDVLDVTALLDSLLGEQATAETAASHLRTTVEDGNTTVSVQTGVDTWKDVVVLHNHDTAVKVLFDDKHSVTVTHD